MSSGLFAVVCPSCGTEMRAVAGAQHRCTTCGTTYVARFGYLTVVADDAARSDLADVIGC